MSQEEYDTKLRSVHRFIPFLENIITQLKDPKMKNREQQLSKMESLYQMIMDRNKKLKYETLHKCEEVIIKLFHKVRGENANLPPLFDVNTINRGDKRRPVDLYSVAGESINKQNSFNELYGCASKSPRKPPISYSDLECLEKDVAHELEKKMSLRELNSLRHHLCKELEDAKTDEINTTVRNKPVLMKMTATSPDKNRRKSETTTAPPKNDTKKELVATKKSDPKPGPPKVLKEAGDLFCNAFSEIDKTYGLGPKKKDEKKCGKEKKDSQGEDVPTIDEKASLKQLSEKAAQLRLKEVEKTVATKPPSDDGTSKVTATVLNPKDDNFKDKEKGESVAEIIPVKIPKGEDSVEKEKGEIGANADKTLLKISNSKTNVSNDKNKEKRKSSTDADLSSPKVDNIKVQKEKSKPTTDVPKITKNTADDSRDKVKTPSKSKSSGDAQSILPKPHNAKTGDSKQNNNKEKVKPVDEADTMPLSKTNISKDKINTETSNNLDTTSNNKDNTSHEEKDKPSIDGEKNSPDAPKDKDAKEKGKSSPNNKEKRHSDHKKEKTEKSHKKDKEVKHKEKSRDKDSKDRLKDKDKKPKPTENKDVKERKSADKERESRRDKKDKHAKEPAKEVEKDDKSKRKDETARVLDDPNKINPEIEDISKAITSEVDYEELSQKLDEIMNANTKNQTETQPRPVEKPVVENKVVNRDPRLKYGANAVSTAETVGRIAFKYNPKPKKPEPDTDLDKNVLDSIEKSMKESSISLPPTLKVSAPPAPPNDLFSPESPDEIDKVAVPPILNDLLLNPKTTGMLNEVVSALRRSNNENNLINIATNVRQKDPNLLGPTLRFSPPTPKMQFEAPAAEAKIFSPTKQPVRGFNIFPPKDQNDYQSTRNQGPHLEPPHLNPYEDRGYFMDRPGNFIPPSPSYVPPGFVPPSPSYVPPSPIYEGAADNFREMNVNYPNFQGSNQQRFFENERGPARSKGLLGDAPSRLPFNNPYGPKNYDGFNCFDPRGNLVDSRSNYYGAPSRDPRIHMNRGPQYPGQDLRPMGRENRMTYREHKEQKERENREREMREKELREKEESERKQKEREEAEKIANEKEKVANNQNETEDKTSDKVDERESDRSGRGRTRDRSRERYSGNRSSSRYRKDRDDGRNRGDRRGDRNERRDRSRDRSRYESKFDKVYSVREKDKDLSLPLNNLFTSKSANGKGYNTQYKIPKKVKEDEPPKEESKKNDDPVGKEKTVKKVDGGEMTTKKTEDSEKLPQEKKPPVQEDKEVKEIKKTTAEEEYKSPEKKQEDQKVSEEKINPKIEKGVKCEEDITEPHQQQSTSIDDKKPEKKEEEENILSKFFQNLMKSGNKDEKKGALLSLISTFSDSFSDHQLQKITSIIRSEDVEEPKKDESKPDDQEMPSTSVEETKKQEELNETESIPEDTQEKIEEESETVEKKEEPEEEPVQVDVAERIKTRRRIETKSKVKGKSELDRLHDDIREMFIRDGVVTATGKRMCRILKDTTEPNPSENDRSEEEATPAVTERKNPTPKRRGRKPGYRKNKETTSEVEMKELTVVLPKMSLEKIQKEALERDDEELDNSEDKETRETLSDDDKETVEKTSPVRRGRRKNRNSWATGVIKRKPGPKSKKSKLPDSPEKTEEKTIEKAEPEVEDDDVPTEGLHDPDYYLRVGQTKLKCKYCEASTKWIAAHYRTEHPNREVLSSRLPPNAAREAIADAVKNREVYENDDEESLSKHEFLCSFCEYRQVTLPKFYRDHVSIHTGEFRHTCPYCSFSRSHIKTMQGHVAEKHAEEEAISRKPLISDRAPNNRNVYAYICELCNFTQMSLENVKKHVETFHARAKKCQIHKIRMNCAEKVEENARQPSERSTRRSTKNSQVREETTPSPETEDVEEESPKKPEVDPLEIKEIDVPETTEVEPTHETTTSPRKLRGTRKRGKSFTAPSPVKKRLKRRCTMNRPSTAEVDDEVTEDVEEKTAKNIDEAVFTSNTDIQEDNKKIEEERLKTMQDINSTIKLRASSDFVEKLSHRLKQEEKVIVKQEAGEVVEHVLEKLPVSDLPVFEKSGIQNRETERQESSPKIVKESGKVNPINGVIEKLQGMLGNPAALCDDVASPNVSSEELSLPPTDTPEDAPPSLEAVLPDDSPRECVTAETFYPPPLIHMNNVEQTVEKSNIINSETLNIGYVKVIKSLATYIYVCCLPPCIFSSRDRAAFARHCHENHKWDEKSPKTTECLECGTVVTCGEDGNLLTSALNHTVTRHSDFLGLKIGRIRISSNLFPEVKDECSERPSTPPTISIPSPPGDDQNDDIDCLLNTEPAGEADDGDNPFPFGILDVMSLADENLPPLNTSDPVVEAQSPDMGAGPSQTQESLPPQAKMKTSIRFLLSKCQSKQQVGVSRKWPVAMKKFLGNHFDLYKCPDYSCLFTTNKRKMFDIHLRMHPNTKRLMNCLYCDKLITFETTGDHYEKLHGMCRFSCSYCLYRCIAKDYMDIHQILAHPDVPSRMQLLPKRDSEDKSSISILREATKCAPIEPYRCCDKEYLHQMPFMEHVESCVKSTNFKCCYTVEGMEGCQLPHNNFKDLVKHWGTAHGVYPLKCAYCSVGDFDLNVMMIHLVLEHPTLPPDIIDRYNVPVGTRNKKVPAISSVQCNFKQLVLELKSNFNGPVPKTAESLQLTVLPPSKPKTMQKAFENFVQKSHPTFSKVTPISILPKQSPSIALLKPTSKANVLNAGGLVYCLSPASSNSQQSLLKAIVINKDSGLVPQKVQLVAPVSSKSDGKYQIVNKIMSPPKLAPLSTVRNVSPIRKSVPGDEIISLSSPDADHDGATTTETNEGDASKDGNVAGESAEMDNFEEPMVIFEDELGDKERDEAVDPLSLETEDPLTSQPSDSPRPDATPIVQDYDSEVDQSEMLVQKSGLVGYQLFRCAKCDMFFPGDGQFKEHLIKSTQCRFENSPHKPYKCFHCGKYLKYYTNLLDHLRYHGQPRFTCSLCNKKFPHANQVKYHMKTQHNVLSLQMQPSIPTKSNLNDDSFIAKPQVIGGVKTTIKETNSECDAQKAAEVKTVYYSFEADQIPQKSILGYDITCGHCKKFKNKVRSNIVRHLLLHQNDKDFTVPDTAPVNPVPCLEKNEKMFDKMCNLASSSHTGGRMGGQQKGESSKDKVKDNNHPAFVPINKRYQCCAVGCNYLCLEEGNLRHHLTALHMEDLSFVCVHCKRDLSDAADVDTIIKHLKLHDLHLYKCSSCDYMHNLKHKIERHIGDEHKNKDSTVVVIRAMDAEPYDDNQQQPFVPAAVNQKLQKLWRCCMCKYKCHTEEEVVNHVKNKHNIDCRYKCALCTFKTDEVAQFKGHYNTNHPVSEVDIISVYHKEDDNNGAAVSESEQFDTTPLWLRDKPRVRHIRGILFEEDTAMKKKSTPVKADQAAKDLPVSKKRKRSMSTVSEGVETKKEALEPKTSNTPSNNDVIVIEDDETEVAADKTVDPAENQELNDVDLICMFGDIGMPLNKNFKCPKCEKYKTTKMREFIQHVAGELRYFRFLCKICQEKFITLENIQMHCIDYHDCSVKSVVHLPVDASINNWLTLLLTGQRKIMMNLGVACEDIPTHIEDFLGRMEIFSNKAIKCKECGFSVSGPQAMDRHMKYNHPHIAFAPQQRSTDVPEATTRPQTSTTDKKRRSVEPTEGGGAETKKIKTTPKTNSMAKDKYVCKECGAEFNSVPEMEFHCKENHDAVLRYTVKTTNLPISVGVHRNVFRCRYCATTGTKTNLELHISTDHPGQKLDIYKFSCGFCSAKFENLKSFRQHFKSHDHPDMFYYDVYDRKVSLQSTSTNATKTKIYKCPKCHYTSNSANSANIKHHLKLHAKPFQCELCQCQFKTRPEARTHHLKEHPHNAEVISTRQDMVQLINQMMKEVLTTAKDAEVRDKLFADDAVEEELPESMLQPEVILKTNEEDLVDVESMQTDSNESSIRGKKFFAKKSTGLNLKPDETKEYYSFYGQIAESVDMKKIITNFEIADARVKISCDQLGRIYNLNPVIQLKDCMTLIIDDDDALSS